MFKFHTPEKSKLAFTQFLPVCLSVSNPRGRLFVHFSRENESTVYYETFVLLFTCVRRSQATYHRRKSLLKPLFVGAALTVAPWRYRVTALVAPFA